jgi:hypothetical protein
VVLDVDADVSEEHVASIFRVEGTGFLVQLWLNYVGRLRNVWWRDGKAPKKLSSVYDRKVVWDNSKQWTHQKQSSPGNEAAPTHSQSHCVTNPCRHVADWRVSNVHCRRHCWGPVYANAALTVCMRSMGWSARNRPDASGCIFVIYLTTLPRTHYTRCLSIRVCRLHHVIVNAMRLNTISTDA